MKETLPEKLSGKPIPRIPDNQFPQIVETILSETTRIEIFTHAHVKKDKICNQFYVTVPFRIDGKEYSIVISGNLSLISGIGFQLPSRGHPFNISKSSDYIYFLKTVTRKDIFSSMTLILKNSEGVIRVSNDFFDSFRNQLPSNHPLSTLPQP